MVIAFYFNKSTDLVFYVLQHFCCSSGFKFKLFVVSYFVVNREVVIDKLLVLFPVSVLVANYCSCVVRRLKGA